ncbi:DUF134 domain-containing protein [candidate division WOR-3 bacterium]|nr:DUF134 domain-containing protein [candidate division WOR-3 bacterium]MCK4528484.1 DUF134 domain-containing protein [candidate division WOR-3 bacterium]
MGRPHIKRRVDHPPAWWHFMPDNRCSEGKVILQLDEYEAVRLSDYLGLSHSGAAEKMGVSRSTFTRLIRKAHKKIGEAISLGKEILIIGGNVRFQRDILCCQSCGSIITYLYETLPPGGCPQCGSNSLLSLANRFLMKNKGV